jgi:Mlc titration factor MtfA (ptsG expression regulator)
LLDQYGATNPSEFFAVATEVFFERPRALKARHPALYSQLQQFYKQDPTTYSVEEREGGGGLPLF